MIWKKTGLEKEKYKEVKWRVKKTGKAISRYINHMNAAVCEHMGVALRFNT